MYKLANPANLTSLIHAISYNITFTNEAIFFWIVET